jgi:predicted MPP superfamily phosphohydrolase
VPPAWNGLRILQVADVHAGLYMGAERMRRIRRLIESIPADLVVFTGDQIDRRWRDAELFVRGFAGVGAPLGVFGVLGNHDHYIDPALSERALRRAGITPLVNAAVELSRNGQRLTLVGLEDLQASRGRLPAFGLLRNHPSAFRICLCHQPQGWPRAQSAGAHLTLSGHTHGGQIALNTRALNVARLHTRYIAGPYRRDDGFLYVSRGIGVGAVPLRVGAPPELDLITLRSAAAAAAA